MASFKAVYMGDIPETWISCMLLRGYHKGRPHQNLGKGVCQMRTLLFMLMLQTSFMDGSLTNISLLRACRSIAGKDATAVRVPRAQIHVHPGSIAGKDATRAQIYVDKRCISLVNLLTKDATRLLERTLREHRSMLTNDVSP